MANENEEKKVALNASVAPDQFDWDAFEKETVYDTDRATIAEQYDKTLSKVTENEVVEGVVTSVNKKEVVVNIGYKSEGVIPTTEFRYNPDIKVGDKVEVYVQTAENKNGQLILSHKKARAMHSWDLVNDAFNKDEIIKGYVKTRTKGGMIVDVFGIEAFLPGSQIDVKPIRDYDQFVDTTMDLKIVKIVPEFRNIVVSHKALIEAELEAQKSEIISKLEKGQVLEGTVKNVTDYGVLVMAGIDGSGKLSVQPLEIGLKSGEAAKAVIAAGSETVPEHYSHVATFHRFLKIYDDNELAKKYWGKEIRVFRAGRTGVLIQIFMED